MHQIEIDLYLHVRVLITIILGLSVTRLLGGLAQFMRQSDHHRFSWIHLGWVAWVFFNVIAFWWWEFRLSQVTHWTFALYLRGDLHPPRLFQPVLRRDPLAS